MKDVWIFIAGIVFNKLIDNNLPDLSFKNLKKMATQVFRYSILILAAVVPYLALRFKLVKQLHPKTELLMGLAALILIVNYVVKGKFYQNKYLMTNE